MKVIALFLALLLTDTAVNADGECHGTFNNLAPWSGDLTKIKEVANGSLYTAGDGDDQIFGMIEQRKRQREYKGSVADSKCFSFSVACLWQCL